jgi:hypothetical protein
MRARIVTEISCYLDNKPGIVANLSSRLAKADININGMQVYEGSLQSLVMVIVNQTDLAEKVMREMNIDMISLTDILEVDVASRIGGLAEITTILGENNINIKSFYLVDNHSLASTAYIRVDEVEESQRLLNKLASKLTINTEASRPLEHRPIGNVMKN